MQNVVIVMYEKFHNRLRNDRALVHWKSDNTNPKKNNVGSTYYQLRQLRHITQSLSPTVAQTLVQAFISCRLDYCNSLFYGIADSQLRRLQSVQNAAARLITGTRRTEHITPVLQSLHWLPVRQRILFKVAVLVHNASTGVHQPTWLMTAAGSITPGRS